MVRSKLLGIALVLAGLFPAGGRAQTLTQVPFADVSNNPTGLKMFYYIPTGATAPMPVVVVLHHCGGTAEGMKGRFAAQADKYKFMMVLPDSNRNGGCWDVASTASLKHPSESDPLGIVSMVQYAVDHLGGDADRVYVTGESSGAMMTNVLLATYPEVFQAGAAIMGVPAGCFATGIAGPPRAGTATTKGPDINAMSPVSYWSGDCGKGLITKTPEQWGDLARSMYPSYAGPRPRMMLYHGETDATLSYPNFGEEIDQWTNVLGLSATPVETDAAIGTLLTPSAKVTNVWTRTRYGDAGPTAPLEAFHASGLGHTVGSTDVAAAAAVRFFGLGDAVAPAAPGGLAASAVTPVGATLTWTAATDDVAVTAYAVYRVDGSTATPIAWPTTTTYALTGLSGSTAYKYEVVAVDLAGNVSPVSGAVEFTTPADTTPPSAPTNLVAGSITQTGGTLTWTASTDDVGVTSYVVSRQDGASWVEVGTPTTATLAVSGLTAATAYTFQVVAVDGSGNHSTPTQATFTTSSASGGGGGGGCGQGAPSGAALVLLAAGLLLLRRRTSRA